MLNAVKQMKIGYISLSKVSLQSGIPRNTLARYLHKFSADEIHGVLPITIYIGYKTTIRKMAYWFAVYLNIIILSAGQEKKSARRDGVL
ncbi:Uncharacterized protein APZ42_030335 [Daphnia magna]|uniref:Uncharacterized protein n=1 Tax=Daphnia magna TaxID=35525 RepID=A0A164NV02_9CRUS|nr:Uncharacterized protein APZ42_030335 [Daphnia magna]